MAQLRSDSNIAGGSDIGAASNGDNDGARPVSGGRDGSGGDTDQGHQELGGKVQQQRRLKTQVVRPFFVEEPVQSLITTQEQEQQELDNVDQYNAQKQEDAIKKELLSDRRGALALKTDVRKILDLSPSSSADSDGDLDADLEILPQRQEQEKRFYLYMPPSPAGEDSSNASSPRLSERAGASSDEEIEVDLESNEFSEQEHENGYEFEDMESNPSTAESGADGFGLPSVSASPSTPSSVKDDQLKSIQFNQFQCQDEELAFPATAVDEHSSNSSTPKIPSTLKNVETTSTGEDDIHNLEETPDSSEGQKQVFDVVPSTPIHEQSSNPPTSSASERVETLSDKEVDLIDPEPEKYNQQDLEDHGNVDESVGSRASARASSTTQLGNNGVSVSAAPSSSAPFSNANGNSTDTEGKNENNGRASPLLAWVGPPMCINCGRTFVNLRALRDHVLSVHPGPGTGKYKGRSREQASSSTSEAHGAGANKGGKAKRRSKSSSRKRPNSAEAEMNRGGGGDRGRKPKRQTLDTFKPSISGRPSPISSQPTPTGDDFEQQIKVYPDAEDGRRFGCPGCERRFLLRCALLDHLRIHTGEKPFVCPHRSCSRPFRRNDNLLRHMRTNHKERPSSGHGQ